MSNFYQKYKLGLDYLKSSGLDLVVKQDFFIKTVLTYQEHSYFGETKENLARPYKLANNVLSKQFLDHYDLITKVDLARFLRVVSIILTNFTGPKDNDHFDTHIYRLQDLFLKPSYENEALVMEALLAYNEVLGKKTNLPREDYHAYARILNHLWYIFEPAEESLASDDSYDDWSYGEDMTESDDFDFAADFDQYANWAYKEILKDFTEEKFLKMIKDDMQLNSLQITLTLLKLSDLTKEQLLGLANDKNGRKKLIKKVNEWYKKEHPN